MDIVPTDCLIIILNELYKLIDKDRYANSELRIDLNQRLIDEYYTYRAVCVKFDHLITHDVTIPYAYIPVYMDYSGNTRLDTKFQKITCISPLCGASFRYPRYYPDTSLSLTSYNKSIVWTPKLRELSGITALKIIKFRTYRDLVREFLIERPYCGDYIYQRGFDFEKYIPSDYFSMVKLAFICRELGIFDLESLIRHEIDQTYREHDRPFPRVYNLASLLDQEVRY